MIRSFQGKVPKVHEGAFISEAAYIVGDVEIGEASSVWPGAVVRADFGRIVIGVRCAIEDNCVLHCGSPSGDPDAMNLIVGDDVVFGHGAVVNAKKIGSRVLIGMNATVLHDVAIGSDCILAAGCVVRPGMVIPDGSFVAGIPAEIKGPATKEQLFWTVANPAAYPGLAEQYKKEGL